MAVNLSFIQKGFQPNAVDSAKAELNALLMISRSQFEIDGFSIYPSWIDQTESANTSYQAVDSCGINSISNLKGLSMLVARLTN